MVESKVLQYFSNLFALFFKLQLKQPRIQSRNYHIALPEVLSTSFSFFLTHPYTSCPLRQKILTLKLPLSGCWSITNAENKPGIERSDNPLFNGISTIVGYLLPNSVYTHIIHFGDNILKWAWAFFGTQLKAKVLLYKSQFNISHLFPHIKIDIRDIQEISL